LKHRTECGYRPVSGRYNKTGTPTRWLRKLMRTHYPNGETCIQSNLSDGVSDELADTILNGVASPVATASCITGD